MKTLLLVTLAAAAAIDCQGEGPVAGPPPPTPFDLIGSDYKKAVEVPETFFNPFKIEASSDLALQKKGAALTVDTVAAAISHRGVSGIVFGAGDGPSRVIIGDQVFRVGDELTFFEADKGLVSPLIAGASVVLRVVGQDSLAFDFSPEGETPKRASFSLRNFWQP